MQKYYLTVSAGVKVAVVDRATHETFWWDGLPAVSKEESQGLPVWDINRSCWV